MTDNRILGGMLRGMMWATIALACCSSVFGSTIINCSYDPNNVVPTYTQNNCLGPNFTTFNESIDWRTAFGAADNNFHNVTGGNGATVATNGWQTTLGGVGLTVSLGPYANTTQLIRADNTIFACAASPSTPADCKNGSTLDFAQGFDPNITTFGGHFNSLDPNNPALWNQFYGFGDHLLGTANGGPMNFAIASGYSFSSIGFAISTRSDANVVARLDAYDGTNYLGSYGISTSGGGGTCTALQTLSNTNGPNTPCNDAPFIGISGSHITSIVVYTTDTSGFFVDTLFANTVADQPPPPDSGAPEPSTCYLLAGGFGALIVARTRRR